MKKNIRLPIFLFFLLGSFYCTAQNSAINTTGNAGDASAALDIDVASKGLLIPRLSLTQTSSASPVTSPATSLLIYNTATANDVTPGFYYWDGSKWLRLLASSTGSSTSSFCYICR